MRKRMPLLFVVPLLVVCMLIRYAPFAMATTNDSIVVPESCESQLVEQLAFMINYQKQLGDEDYIETVTVLQPISSYECINQKIIQIPVKTYPILVLEELAFFAIITKTDYGEYHIQITDCFVDALKEYTGHLNKLVLIYDSHSCYLVDYLDGDVEKLSTYPEIDERDSFDFTLCYESLLCFSDEQRQCSQRGQELVLSQNDLRGMNSAAQLNVPWVPQTASNICWAASVACIGNYSTSYWHSAQYIAQSVYGSSNWNQPAYAYTAMTALYSEYILSYPYYSENTSPTDSRIYNNISSGYPVYSKWTLSGGNHACVIRGISTGSYVMVVDPEFGNTTAYKSNEVYSYYSSVYSKTLTLSGYGAKIY